MKFEVQSEVIVPSIGRVKHTHVQEFADDSNVFGRVLEYRKYMYEAFPRCKFCLIEAREI